MLWGSGQLGVHRDWQFQWNCKQSSWIWCNRKSPKQITTVFFHSRNSTRIFQCLVAAMTHFLSFVVPPSFSKTFSYSVFNYLHFPIKFCLLMLHCFAPRRRNLKLKFQTHHTTSESEMKVLKTQTGIIDASERQEKKLKCWEVLSHRPRWCVSRVICITSLNVRLMIEELRRLRTPRVI